VRREAARALGGLGPHAAEASAALTGLLEDEETVREEAAQALTLIRS
jgi:HEAT repeat protein